MGKLPQTFDEIEDELTPVYLTRKDVEDLLDEHFPKSNSIKGLFYMIMVSITFFGSMLMTITFFWLIWNFLGLE